MQDVLIFEVRQKTVTEIIEVLRKHNLPVTPNICDAVCALMKEVSCAHQNGSK